MPLLTKIILCLGIDKIIDSVNRWRKSTNEIKIKNRASEYKNIANYARAENLNEVGDYIERKAKIEEERLK